MKNAVILLHGRGGSAEDILGLRQELDFPDAEYFAPEAEGHTWYPELVPGAVRAQRTLADALAGQGGRDG